MTESMLVTKIQKYLADRRKAGMPLFWFKIHGGPAQRAGMPDLFVCHNGRALFLEAKTSSGKATTLQCHTIDKIIEAGGTAVIVRSVDDVKKLIDG